MQPSALRSDDFIRALEEADIEAIRAVPKTDLHNHACLGYRLDVLSEHTGVVFPQVPSMMPDFEVFVDYLKTHLHPHIYTREGFEFSIGEALKEARKDGVAHLEMSVDAQMYGVYGNPDDVVHFLEAVSRRYPEVHFLPEVGVNREWAIEKAEAFTLPLLETGFFRSIDLYGNEKFGEPETFVNLFRRAEEMDMILKAHAGEFRDAEFVRRSIEVLHLDEVQHGIAIAESQEVMRWVADCGVALNVCPTSNVRLSRVREIANHPAREIFDAGVDITINSDDIMVFDSAVSEEYLALYQAGVLNARELNDIRLKTLRKRGVIVDTPS